MPTQSAINATEKLYVAFFQRPADPAGLIYWATLLDNLGSNPIPASVINAFVNAPETASVYGPVNSTTIGAVIDSIYNAAFGRPADAGGKAFYANGFAAGQFSTASILSSILNGAGTADKTILDKKVAAATNFTQVLDGRDIANPLFGTGDAAKFNVTFNSTDAAGKARQWLATVPATGDGTVAGATTYLHDVLSLPTDLIHRNDPTDPGPSGQSFTLTAGNDKFAGGDGNDSFNSTVSGGFAGTDDLDGGGGADTLTVTDSANLSAPNTVSVKNIETASLTSTAGTVTVNTSTGWTGLTQLTLSAVGVATSTAASTTRQTVAVSSMTASTTSEINGGSDISMTGSGSTNAAISIGATVAPTGAVTVNRSSGTAAASFGDIVVKGGTTVTITQAGGNANNTFLTLGQALVTGTAATTSVTVNNAAAANKNAGTPGVIRNSITITDVNNASTTVAGNITTATLSNFTTATINDNALTTLSVTGGSGNITIGNGNLNVPTNKSLALTINGQTGGALSDSGVYTTVNATTTGSNSTLANVSMAAVTTLNVAGTKVLTLTATAGLAVLATATVSGAAGLAADLSGINSLTAVSTSATTGSSTVTIDGTKATFTGGAGVDKVTVATGLTKAISLGNGDDFLTIGALVPTVALDGGGGTDTVSMTTAAAVTASLSGTFAGLATNFERLTLTGSATNVAVDLAVLGNYSYVSTSIANGLTLNNMPSGGTLVLTGAGTKYTVANAAFTAGVSDVINLTLTDGSGTGSVFASVGVTANDVETINITTVDAQAVPSGTFNDVVTLLGNNTAKTITVAGNAGLSLTAASTALTSLDASGIVGTSPGGLTWTSGVLTGAATIKGSAGGTNQVFFSTTGGVVTYTGGSGNDYVNATAGGNNIINLGNGDNSFSTTGGNNVITAGSGGDSVDATSGNNTATLGNGANYFSATSGNNTVTTGTGADYFSVGGGSNTLTTGTGADTVNITAVGANLSSFTTITDAHSTLVLQFPNKGTEVFASAKLTGQVSLQAYADAAIFAGGNGTNNGRLGWFQFSGDTYVVEVRHDGTTVSSFVNGTDLIVKFTGLVDLSTATLSAISNTLTLA